MHYGTNSQGYDSVPAISWDEANRPFPGAVGLIVMVMVNLDGQYTCGTQNDSATPLRVGWHAS